ncbi:hypothetical protein N665_2818s0001 [Sinapis alba]|nr:hypothetical protein N665_2818s0001 [Sinapis alba]
MEIAGTVVACVANLAFKYAENVAKDLELFAHHAGRKVVNMNDVVLSVVSLRSLDNELKIKSLKEWIYILLDQNENRSLSKADLRFISVNDKHLDS